MLRSLAHDAARSARRQSGEKGLGALASWGPFVSQDFQQTAQQLFQQSSSAFSTHVKVRVRVRVTRQEDRSRKLEDVLTLSTAFCFCNSNVMHSASFNIIMFWCHNQQNQVSCRKLCLIQHPNPWQSVG